MTKLSFQVPQRPLDILNFSTTYWEKGVNILLFETCFQVHTFSISFQYSFNLQPPYGGFVDCHHVCID